MTALKLYLRMITNRCCLYIRLTMLSFTVGLAQSQLTRLITLQHKANVSRNRNCYGLWIRLLLEIYILLVHCLNYTTCKTVVV